MPRRGVSSSGSRVSCVAFSLVALVGTQVHTLRIVEDQCIRYESGEIRDIIAHVSEFFNYQTPRPIGDGVSLWQLSLVQAMRYGGAGVRFQHPMRSAGEARDAEPSFAAHNRINSVVMSAQEQAQEQLFQSVPFDKWSEIMQWWLEELREIVPPEDYRASDFINGTHRLGFPFDPVHRTGI